MVGGTAWKVKIVTRRVQDKKKSISNTSARVGTKKKRDKYGKRRSRTTVFKMILIEEVVFWSVGVGWMGGRRQGAAVPARLAEPNPAHVKTTIYIRMGRFTNGKRQFST